ncbi:hypothetical protein [Vibrio sp.]
MKPTLPFINIYQSPCTGAVNIQFTNWMPLYGVRFLEQINVGELIKAV